MKVLTAIMAILVYTGSFAQSDTVEVIGKVENLFDPFVNLSYDKVIAYNLYFDSIKNERKAAPYIGDISNFSYLGTLKSSRRSIDATLTNKLIDIVSDKSTYGAQYGDCFFPRLGITFLLKDQEVFTILVCFECNFLESTTPIPAARHSYYDINSTAGEEERPIIIRRYQKGFSKKGKARLLKFCKKLKMSYCH